MKFALQLKIAITFVLLCFILCSIKSYGQSNGCTPPPPPAPGAAMGSGGAGGGGGGGGGGGDCGGGGGPTSNPPDEDDDDDDWDLDVIGSIDPNEIISPVGFDSARFVSVNDNMGYTITFENDPKLATAPAHNVYLYYPISAKQDKTTFRLGSYGFNEDVFTVPQNVSFYSTQLDLQSSLGLFVNVTAGIDVVNSRAFWIFESIDPLTGLAPSDPNSGFLPVKDSTLNPLNDTLPAKGEGFVSFTMKPLSTDITRDTIFATAKIVFDTNDTIPTNIEFNTIDAVPPVSSISAGAIANNSVQLNFLGTDDNNGSGVRDYDLYVAQDSLNYIKYISNSTDSVINFPGTSGSQFHFFTLATDNTGNREALKSAPDVSVIFTGGTTWFADNDSDSFGNVLVQLIAGSQPQGYVSDSTDCNDANANIKPGAAELCNSIDDNCNGQTDEGDFSPANATAITGPLYVCINQNPIIYSVATIANATAYKWKLPAGMSPVSGTTSTSNNSITVKTTASFNGGNINVKGINACDTGVVSPNMALIKATVKPGFPTAINGKTGTVYEFCAENNYVLTTTSQKATSFTWSASNWVGATGSLIPNSVVNGNPATGMATLQLPTGFLSVTVTATASNCIGTTDSRKLIIKSLPNRPPVISPLTGNNIICPVNADYTFNFIGVIAGADSYHWSATGDVTPSSITNFVPTATFHFNSGFTAGTVKVAGVNACGEGTTRFLAGLSTHPVKPDSIYGPSTVCKLTNPINTYSIVSVNGATNYTWSASSPQLKFNDGIQVAANPLTTALLSVNVDFTNVPSGNRTIYVKANDSCSSSVSNTKKIINNLCREGNLANAEDDAEVFPVPAREELHIEFYSESPAPCKFSILDITGRLILEKDFTSSEGETSHTLNVKGLAQGVYSLRILRGEKSETHKIIIE